MPADPPFAPKIAALARLRAAGLPVPAWTVIRDPATVDATTWSEISALLQAGPVIVRTALFEEDTAEASAAGLGTSVADCRDREAVRAALAQISASLADPWLRSYLGAPPRAQVLVQHQISGPWLAVVAQERVRYAELHLAPGAALSPAGAITTAPRTSDANEPQALDPSESSRPDRNDEPLAAGRTPALSAPLEWFPPALARQISEVCDRVTAATPPAVHGLDLELVADHRGEVWVVQVRPLTRPLHPGWPAFAAAASRDLGPTTADGRLPLAGTWVLDAEHNPDPLSPAHAGLVRRLAAERPDLAPMRVLAGWLYTQRSAPLAAPVATPRAAAAALRDLRERLLPAARRDLARFDTVLATADRDAVARLVDRAVAHLLATLADYAALHAGVPRTTAAATDRPLCLQERAGYLDVLPATWDIASPTLADLSLGTSISPADLSPGTSASPTDLSLGTSAPPLDVPEATAAVLLRELDDHLFALGLAPARRCYLRAADLLGLGPDVFLLAPDELQSALRGPAPLRLDERRAEHAAQARLSPPLQISAGAPVPGPSSLTTIGGHLRGLGIGPSAEGPLHPRRDLADLLARPVPPGAVLAMPALTAQAAVALDALGVRAVCCEHGGAMSHAALMARELGLSALIGCRGCTGLAPGTHVRLDTRAGRLRPSP